MPVKINPYNFVPFVREKPKRTSWEAIPKHHRLADELYSGFFDLTFTTITPIFIPSPLKEDQEKEPVYIKGKKKYKVTFKKFYHRNGTPIIPGSSIKGMVRSVFEALTDSCMVLFAEIYGYQQYPSNFKNENCNNENGLCPACSVFGTISEEDTVLQGKVFFEDAVGKKEDLKSGCWIIKELSAPKPERHPPFYALKDNSPSTGPRGRKFYFHHMPSKFENHHYFTTNEHNIRNRKILQYLRKRVQLRGKIIFQGLTEIELANLIYTLELGATNAGGTVRRIMAHKIGMGKPIGLGSIGIFITRGTISKGPERYKFFKSEEREDIRNTINELVKKAAHPSPQLRDLLSLTKSQNGDIEYPSYWWFSKNKYQPLGKWGEFEGSISEPRQITSQDTLIEEAKAPSEDPPTDLPHDAKAVWLKKLCKDLLVFEDNEGKEVIRKPNAFQGKKTLLKVGHWYFLKGSKAVWPL